MVEGLPDTMKKVHVPTYDEILEKVQRRYLKGRRGRGLRRIIGFEMQRIDQVYQIIESKLRFLDSLPSPSIMHPFYRELIRLTGEDYLGHIKSLRHAQRIVRQIRDEYRYKLLAAETAREAATLRREAIGRMLSVVKRRRASLEKLKSIVIMLSKTPTITDDPKLIVAGAPQAGKSTLVARISSASPEVAPYPFTTKNVILGHANVEGVRLQIIDTPGILDRPLEKRNEIEYRAILALRYLSDSVIFLLDPSDEAYYDLGTQVRILDDIASNIVGDKDRIVVAINKVDIARPGSVEKAEKLVSGKGYGRPFRIVAKTGENVEDVLKEALRIVRSKGLVKDWRETRRPSA